MAGLASARACSSRRLWNQECFITVTDPGWDTHAGNFDSLQKTRMPPWTRPAELLIDLEEHGLLGTTLVVWMTDFGRTPKINPPAAATLGGGLRRHGRRGNPRRAVLGAYR
jgi:uncharacterized protein (DUF1501 family)